MSILFYSPWIDQNEEWLRKIKKKFKEYKIYTLDNKPNLSLIKYALIWNLEDNVLKKMKNVKVLFSLGAGVDHILNLNSYNGQTVIRIKDPFMGERMNNYILSQILSYQLSLNLYRQFQNKKKWIGEREPILNNKITVGILGMGFLGSYVGKRLKSLGYNIIGFKSSKPITKYKFSIYYKKADLRKFLNKSNIVISILPSTPHTKHFIDQSFLNKMKKESLLINVGRGSTLNEKNLIKHLKQNSKFYASLDVFENEPLSRESALWSLKNVTITPHTASVTYLDTAIDYIYKKIDQHSKNGKIKSNIDLNKGY
tara:strand:- start:164 stop:1099 length:936 start_codon:yes stop_codon:yes gene_type:complete